MNPAKTDRYRVVTWHGEMETIYMIVDTSQPIDEQPAVVRRFSTATAPNALYLAYDFCNSQRFIPIPVFRRTS